MKLAVNENVCVCVCFFYENNANSCCSFHDLDQKENIIRVSSIDVLMIVLDMFLLVVLFRTLAGITYETC